MKLLPSIVGRSCFLAVLVISVTISSCIKEKINTDRISNSVDWPVAYGLPIAYGSLTLGDIVSAVDNQGYVNEDKNGLLYLLYRDHVFSQTAGNLLTIPSQNYWQYFSTFDKNFPVSTGFDSVRISRDTSFVFLFNKSDVEVDTILFKAGQLDISNDVNFGYDCRIDMTFPTFKKNGNPLVVSVKKSSTSTPSANVGIDGYKLKFVKKGTSANLIPVHYNITVFNKKAAITSGKDMTSMVTIASAEFSSIYGYLGQIPDLLSLMNQKITLDFFGGSDNYNVLINNPSINLYITNSFGIPIQVQVNNVKTYSDKTSSFFPISFAPSTFMVKSPTLVGKSTYDTIQVTSNFLNAIPTSPHYFYYSEVATTNPLGKVPGNTNFFTDSSKINVDMELKLPFDLKAGNLETSDTIDFDLGKTISDFSIVKKLAIFNTFTNSMPFDLNMQIFLADANKVIIDSLYRVSEQPVIKSGVDDGTNTGHFKAGKATTLTITFDEARAKKLEKVKYAIMKVGMTTAGGGATYVKFYSDYRINCAFQVQTELHVTSFSQF